jgi:hypothetical protein
MATLRESAAVRADQLKDDGQPMPGDGAEAAADAKAPGWSASQSLRDDEQRLVEERLAQLKTELKPEGVLQNDCVRDVATAMVRIELCQLDEAHWRYHRAQRAEYYWEEDRHAEAEEVAGRLARKPALTRKKLRQTLHSVLWLREAWADLAARVAGAVGEPPRPLNERGRQRGFDLLGLSAEQRIGVTPLDLAAGSGAGADPAALARHQAALIAIELADLDRLSSEKHVALDQANRRDAMLGNFPGIDRMTRQIRRDEAQAVRLRDQALATLRQLQETAARAREMACEEEADRHIYAEMKRRAQTRGAEQTPSEPQAQPQARPESQPETTETTNTTPSNDMAAPDLDRAGSPRRPTLAERHAAGERLSRRQRKELARRAAYRKAS